MSLPEDKTLSERISEALKNFEGIFSLETVYSMFPDEKESTIRGRVYRELMGRGTVQRVSKGLYQFNGDRGEKGVIINGDARDLSVIESGSVHLVMADHPYEIQQGRSRSYNGSYADTTFRYEEKDFMEKARVLVPGGFLVEFLPELKEGNSRYISSILTMAHNSGFQLYCKVPWFKARVHEGKLVNMSANVGRKSVLEDVYIFCKGKPRALRERVQGASKRIERGAKRMFPAVFMATPKPPRKRNHQAEKPVELLKEIIENLTLKDELVVDQFAGSFNTFRAALELGRRVISIELNEHFLPFQIIQEAV
nr:hypothetical protein BdHM001_34940 [Bdellovibrio sp. HM001]